MEDLTKLVNDVSEKVKEVQELRKNRDDLQRGLVETMQENFEKLFQPDAVALTRFINSIQNDGNISWRYDGDYYCWFDENGEAKFVNTEGSLDDTPIVDGQFYLRVFRSSSNKWYSRFGVRGCTFEDVDNGLPCWYSCSHFESYLEGFLPYLKTEEDTLKCTKLYKKVFSDILGRILENCDSRIEGIKGSIEKLKNELSSASTVVENDDGSIELTLNGKTYIGTVKEKK